MEIKRAAKKDIDEILNISKIAFVQYQKEIQSDYKVPALYETKEEIEFDIEHNNVYVIREKGVLLGSIRFKRLSEKLAYVYRFAVDPEEQSGGVGTALIEYVIEECKKLNFTAIALHTNTKYFKLARYYYGKQFYVHSTSADKGYIRALFVKELSGECDLSPAFKL